jgi:hypothetical protein
MTYVPNADDPSQPTGDKKVSSAAPEFRTLKLAFSTLEADTQAAIAQLDGFQAQLDTIVAGIDSGGTSTELAAALADATLANHGGGLIGFSYALGYSVGTIARWLQDLALSTGAGFIGWIQSGTGAVLRTISDRLRDTVSVFDYMTAAQIADVKAGSLTLDVTAAVQAAIDANYGKIIFCPKGAYKITSTITVLVYANGGANNIGVHLKGECTGPLSGSTSGTRFQVVGAIDCINVYNSTAFNGDARIIIEDLTIYGDGANSAGGSGIIANLANNLLIRNVFISDVRAYGIYLFRCYGSSVEDCTILRCRLWGLWAKEAFNLGSLRRLKVYGGGRSYTSSVQGNVRLSGTGNENLGVVIENVDVSYAGANAYMLFKRSDSSLTSIAVAAGVATVTTLAAHGLSTGNTIAIVGATVAPSLNSIYPPAITVTGSNTFTFVTAAPNGTYTEATLIIGPASYGFFIDSTRGLLLQGYAEDCIGPSLYMGAAVRSFEVAGGYWQGSGQGCVIINDSAQNGKYHSMYLNGAQALLFLSVPAGPHNVDVKNNITLNSGATITQPAIFLLEGQYYSPAAPTTGTWSKGSYVKQSVPTVGQPKGWYCTVAGTPGTWVSEGNL